MQFYSNQTVIITVSLTKNCAWFSHEFNRIQKSKQKQKSEKEEEKAKKINSARVTWTEKIYISTDAGINKQQQ